MIVPEREFLQAWDDTMYPRGPEMPEPVEGAGGAAFGVYPAMRSAASRTGEKSAAATMLPADVAAGAVKGAVTGGVGMAGDIESLIRGVRGIFTRGGDQGKLDAFLAGLEEKTILPTSEDVSKWLDTNVGPVVPEGAPMAKERAGVAQAGQFAGEIVSGPGTLIKGGKAAARTAVKTAKFIKPKVGEMLSDYMSRSGMTPELMAYHGTPARFEKFDASKIGTGEGAQAFGYGLYFAESPNIAKAYATQLSTPTGPLGDTAKYWRANGGDAAFRAFAKDAGLDAAEIESVSAAIKNAGNVYTVDIPDEMVGKMLDWDKPLSEQAPSVRDAINGIVDAEELYKGRFAPRFLDQRTTGGDALGVLNEALGGPDIASTYLREAGIPGVRYLDRSSRAGGEGTRNIVVFPGGEDQVKIIKVE